MVLVRDDLTHSQYVDIPVRVHSRRPATRSNRHCWVDVEDAAGNRIPVLVWDKHATLARSLSPDTSVLLTDFVVQAWPGQPVELHTVSRSSVDPLSTVSTRLLHLSDSHLGYHRRPESGGAVVPWHDEVDCRARFDSAVACALEQDVDAVVHTGDVFDHAVERADLDVLEHGIRRLHSAGIAFLYVLGNHEAPRGRERLEQLAHDGVAYPLDGVPEGYRIEDVTIYGLDHRSPAWWSDPDVRFDPPTSPLSVLCLHQTVSPPYSHAGPDCTLDSVLETVGPEIGPDLVLLGHLHTPLEAPDARVPAFYAGPTARISSHYKQSAPQITLFDLGEEVVWRRVKTLGSLVASGSRPDSV